MSKKLITAFFFFPFLLAGCGTDGNSNSLSSRVDEYEVSVTEAEVTDGDFIYRLVSEQSEYAEGDAVSIYAELEYIGEEDSVEIYHAASPFYFPMEENTRNYTIGYSMAEPLISTVLTKGEPLREVYAGSGGYGAEEEKAYKQFIQKIMNGQFPEGFYEVNGYADFFTENPKGAQTDYDIHAKVEFKVMK